MERGWKPNVEICPPCPRCGSSSTKFCYYNNYSLTQPRYFCKGCRRYWTKGGSLRNIPVGGGCRKTRRAKSIRMSDAVNSQSFLAHGGGTTGYGNHGNIENLHTSGNGGGSTMVQQPTNIDLQQVYANFVNQRPLIGHQEQPHDHVLHGEVDPMSSFGFPNMEMEFGGTNLESFLSEGNGMQFCGYNTIFSNNEEDQGKNYFGGNGGSNCGLPPLPGEEIGWSESNIGFSEHVLNSPIEPEGHVSGECSLKMFDLPADPGTIFRP